MKILFSGGGTLGSVTPLLAIYEVLEPKLARTSFLWVGSKDGVERDLVEKSGLDYKFILAGKWRRYWSWKNFTDLFRIVWAFGQSFKIIWQYRPDVIISAGSFIAIPISIVGWLFGAKIIIHQIDRQKSLTNKILERFASRITVVFSDSIKDFKKITAVQTGNPLRSQVKKGNLSRARQKFKLVSDKPLVLVLGGSTGSLEINQLVLENIEDLLKFCQVVHLTGQSDLDFPKLKGYFNFSFLDQGLADLMVASDLVISRAGMSTLAELSFLAKPSLLVPLKGTSQHLNADYLVQAEAALVLTRADFASHVFVSTVENLLFNQDLRFKLSRNIKQLFPQDPTQLWVQQFISFCQQLNII